MSWDWLPCLIKLLLIRLILLSKLNVKESLPEIRISKIYRQGGVVNLTNIFKLCLVISNISKSIKIQLQLSGDISTPVSMATNEAGILQPYLTVCEIHFCSLFG